jgi:hypothetical protein
MEIHSVHKILDTLLLRKAKYIYINHEKSWVKYEVYCKIAIIPKSDFRFLLAFSNGTSL